MGFLLVPKCVTLNDLERRKVRNDRGENVQGGMSGTPAPVCL